MHATPSLPVEMMDSSPQRAGAVLDGTMLTCASMGEVLREDDNRRLSIAQRLHRDVAGGLVVCTTMMEMVSHACEHGEDPAALKAMLAKLDETIRGTVKIVREITEEQFPLALKAFGLVFAMDKMTRDLTKRGPATVSLSVQGSEFGLPLEQRLSVFRILQALTERSITRADAATVAISCEFSAATLEFLIVHDGTDCLSGDQTDDLEMSWIRGRVSVLPARLLVSCASPEGAHSFRLVMPAPAKNSPTASTTTKLASQPPHENRTQLQHTRG